MHIQITIVFKANYVYTKQFMSVQCYFLVCRALYVSTVILTATQCYLCAYCDIHSRLSFFAITSLLICLTYEFSNFLVEKGLEDLEITKEAFSGE